MATMQLQEETELKRIEDWRRGRLERAGYPSAAAAEMAGRHEIDVHEAISLLERGCPVELALRILL